MILKRIPKASACDLIMTRDEAFHFLEEMVRLVRSGSGAKTVKVVSLIGDWDGECSEMALGIEVNDQTEDGD